MDVLNRIENQFGSVAEYYREKEEESNNRWWDSLSESEQRLRILQNNYKQKLCDEIIEKLALKPSEYAKTVAKRFNSEITHLNSDSYDQHKQEVEAIHNAMHLIAQHYGLNFHNQLPSIQPNHFCISYEYIDRCRYHYKYSDPMNIQTFMQAYTDMNKIKKSLTVRYRNTSNREPNTIGLPQDIHSIGNSSLASIRYTYFKKWGVEDPEGEAIIANITAKYKNLLEQALLNAGK